MKRVQRYWPGKRPEGYQSESSEEEEEIVDEIEEKEDFVEESVNEMNIRDEREDESSEEEEIEQRRRIMRQRALELQEEEDTIPEKESENESQSSSQEINSEEESSEEESSDAESEDDKPMLMKPVFIPKAHRASVTDKQKIEKEKELAQVEKIQRLEDRKKESHQMAAEEIKKEIIQVVNESAIPDVDDTDDLDPEAEYSAWKLRELKRVMRDKQEQDARDAEILEIERRRGLTDAEIQQEDALAKPKKEKAKMKFLQKYFHKGAFFADEEILQKRDFMEPTLEDKFDKTVLPSVLQVKNFGFAGRTKWTHLANEDTSAKDASWFQDDNVKKRILSQMGGIKSNFEKPGKKSKNR